MAINFGIKRNSPVQQTSQGGYQAPMIDRLVSVLSYDLENHTVLCEDERGAKHSVRVKPEQYARMEEVVARDPQKYSGAKYMQHRIDKSMEKNFPAGKSKLILSRSRTLGKDKETGAFRTEAERIIGVTVPAADKTFSGLFSLTYRTRDGLKNAYRVQHWDEFAYDFTDDSVLEKIATLIDDANSTYGEKIAEHNVVRPNVGIQFRAAIKTSDNARVENKDGEMVDGPVYEVVDTSSPLDWIVPEQTEDEQGNKIAEPHLLTGDEFTAYAAQYAEYIQEHPVFADKIGDMIVEVLVYHSYPASHNKSFVLTTGDPKRDKHADKNPLYRHSHRINYVDQEQSNAIEGYNSGFKGVLQVSKNKLIEIDGAPVVIPSYWASALHPYGISGHVQAFVRTAQGYKARVSEPLKLMSRDEFLDNGNSEQHIAQVDQAPVIHTHDSQEQDENDNSGTSTMPELGSNENDEDPFSAFSADAMNLFGENEAEQAPATTTTESTATTTNKRTVSFGKKKE